jgi:ATP-dependent RNA helicase RhlE
MKLPVSVEMAKSGTVIEKTIQELFIVRSENKRTLLEKILYQYHGSVLVFSRTKHNCTKIAKSIRDLGHTAAEIHSNRTLAQRKEALDGFKSGRYRVLVATDIAARGIDVKGIELVINYDIPEDPENYIHRIGRTGRAGHEGRAISFAMPDQAADVKSIERLMRMVLPVSKHPEMPTDEFYKTAESKPHPKGFLYRGMSNRNYGRRKFGGR